MALLERVSTLLRANLQDLLRGAADPEKESVQVLRDLENQLLQLKTQVAQAMAEAHRVERLEAAHRACAAEWNAKAAAALDRGKEAAARPALERVLLEEGLAVRFGSQAAEAAAQAAHLRAAYTRLTGKLVETRAFVDVLLTEMRRGRLQGRAAAALVGKTAPGARRVLDGLENKAGGAAARASRDRAAVGLAGGAASLEESLEEQERLRRVEALLAELKAARQAPPVKPVD